MPNYTVLSLGFIALGIGGIAYTIAYLTIRPILLDWGLLQYIPALGGLTAILGALPLIALTWLAIFRVITFLKIDKM